MLQCGFLHTLLALAFPATFLTLPPSHHPLCCNIPTFFHPFRFFPYPPSSPSVLLLPLPFLFAAPPTPNLSLSLPSPFAPPPLAFIPPPTIFFFLQILLTECYHLCLEEERRELLAFLFLGAGKGKWNPVLKWHCCSVSV